MPVCPRLPPELLDQVVDSLRNSRDALKNCCLTSKPWIPPARKHLFAEVRFLTTEKLELWKATFPDPSTSPAHYTKDLFIGCSQVVTAAGIGEDCWVLAFSRVVHFAIDIDRGLAKWRVPVSLVPFYGFSPVLKSLFTSRRSALPLSQTLNLIRSFPLLEDVSVHMIDHDSKVQPTIIQPSRSLASTETLRPRIHKLDLSWHREVDVLFATELVEGCCSTLEYLKIDGMIMIVGLPHINLKSATQLKDVTFKLWLSPRWFFTTLQTITHDHRELKQITLTLLSEQGLGDNQDIRRGVGEIIYREWLELDHLLVQLNELHLIRVKILYNAHIGPGGSRERRRMTILLPEVVARGVVDLVGRDW